MAVTTAVCKLASVAPLSWARYYTKPEKKQKEDHQEYEARTWRERVHVDEKDIVFIPNMALKWAITDASKLLGLKIPGKGQSRYGKHFESGLLVLEGMSLGIKKADIDSETLFVPSDGRHGGGSRVLKTFPLIPKWHGVATFHVLDDVISQDIFTQHLEEAGRFVGIGRFRPQKGGYYGRFSVESLKWSTESN